MGLGRPRGQTWKIYLPEKIYMEQHETVQVDKPVALAVAYFQTNSNSACNNQFFSTSLLTFTDAAVEVSDIMVSCFLLILRFYTLIFLRSPEWTCPWPTCFQELHQFFTSLLPTQLTGLPLLVKSCEITLDGENNDLSSILFLLAPQDS